MSLQLSQIDDEIKTGLACAHAGWIQQSKEWDYYNNKGTSLVKARTGELGPDYESRAKLSVKVLHRVVNKLASGLYGRGGPGRRVTNSPEADKLYQSVISEHKLDRYLHAADQLAWLHGYSSLQVVPNLDPKRHAGCPVILRPWRADETYVWLDSDGVTPEAVLVRSIFSREKKIRFQVWNEAEIRTYYSRVGDLDLTGSGSHRFDLEESESGENTLGCIPFAWFHNDHPTSTFYTPGIGRCLAETSYACDSLLSDLQQSLSVFCIPDPYGKNMSVQSRLISRPGNIINLTPADESKDVDVFFRQPQLATQEVWLHVQNAINSDLAGLGIPIAVELDAANSQPESGVALAIRWIAPMVDLYRARQETYKHAEKHLARLVCRIAGIATRSEAMVAMAANLELEVDYPEPHLPVPSPERDAQDLFEIEQGWQSAIQVVMQRFGKTRAQALEHLEQVRIDQAELAKLGPAVMATTTPEARAIEGDDRLEDEYEGGQQGGDEPDAGPDGILSQGKID